jgi:hypothetical protein
MCISSVKRSMIPSDVVEGVVERCRDRGIAVAERRVVGGHQMESVGQADEERFVHPRRRREPVKEEEGRRTRAAGFAVEDREPVHVDRSVCRRMRVDRGRSHTQSCRLQHRLSH